MENLSTEKQQEIRATIRGLARGLTIVDHPTPILEKPSDYNMEFEDVKAFVCPQPASMHIMSQITLNNMGLGEYLDILDEEQIKLGGFKSSDMSPHNYAMNVKVPTFIIQVRDDAWTVPDDVQKTYDLIPGNDKKLSWIEGTTKRFVGYNYFGENPEMMLEWFDLYMNTVSSPTT